MKLFYKCRKGSGFPAKKESHLARDFASFLFLPPAPRPGNSGPDFASPVSERPQRPAGRKIAAIPPEISLLRGKLPNKYYL
ncbi:hypothetical protein [Rikenella microfusus]|uniref:hypothetical protein n=1 Tax=Rikenella microfusus TaxID=28139 RepID=UPI000482155F|nr:hypothetical protein [Rikenella microfusus]HJE87734.1 hypothetical protein [Rikenella microfusus]